jgi:hypothetical protein
MSQEISVTLKAYDEASRTVAEASSKIKSDMAQVEQANKRVVESQKQTMTSTRDLVTGFSGVATSAFSLYNAYDRVADMQLNVDRANLQVKQSNNSMEDAQRRVTSTSEILEKAQKATYEATIKYGAGSKQSAEALAKEETATRNNEAAKADLELAQERLTVAQDRAEQVQDNMNEAMIQSALQVIPTTITMVDSLSKAWKNFPDMSKTLSGVAAKVSEVGITAKTAALGVAAFMGGFLIADTVLNAIPEDMRAIAGALTATIAAIVAATVAWMAFHGTMTVGVAVPIILAAVGVGIAGIKAAVGMAEGGIVRKPTLALLGESGPEAVIPLNSIGVSVLSSSESQTQNITINPVINIGNISGDIELPRVTESVSRGIFEALRRRI